MFISKPARIAQNLSVYLDFLRFSAALIVFLTHAHNFLLPTPKFGPLAWGREAVAVFFVLSGFVISYVVATKETDWRDYAIARFSRMMPVALVAITVTVIADALGTMANPAYYDFVNQKFDGFYVPVSLEAFASYVSFTNQIWFRHAVFGSAEPYWSLGFEVQYYLFFFLWTFVPRRYKLVSFIGWALFAGPKILMYLPLWLLGVATMRTVVGRKSFTTATAILMLISSAVTFVLLKYFLDRSATNMYQVWTMRQELVNLLYFNSIGFCVALHTLGAASLLGKMRPCPGRISAGIRWLAGASFTLYLAHQPIIVALASLVHPVEVNVAAAIGCIVFAFALCFLLAEVAERRKSLVARALRQNIPTLHTKA